MLLLCFYKCQEDLESDLSYVTHHVNLTDEDTYQLNPRWSQQHRSSLVFQGVSATPAPPFYLHESINVQIKLFIKVERGAGGSAYCDQQWGQVSLDVKSSNYQITPERCKNWVRNCPQPGALLVRRGFIPSNIGPAMFSASLGPGNGSSGGAKIDGPAKFARRKDEGVFKVSDNRRDQTLYFLHCL